MESLPIYDAKQLGELIRGRRRELGLTQTEVAEVANTNLRFVSELERGKPTARLENVMRVLATLGIELEARVR
jgi:HTH-type transcriptional regulator/antitoxin HipB